MFCVLSSLGQLQISWGRHRETFLLSHCHPKAPSDSLGRHLIAGSVPGRIQVKITLQSSELDSAKPGFPLPSGDERIWDTPSPVPQSGCPEGPFGPGCSSPSPAEEKVAFQKLLCQGSVGCSVWGISCRKHISPPCWASGSARGKSPSSQSHRIPEYPELERAHQDIKAHPGPAQDSPNPSLCWRQRVTWSIFKNVPLFELPEGPSSRKAPGSSPDSFASAWAGAGIPAFHPLG